MWGLMELQGNLDFEEELSLPVVTVHASDQLCEQHGM
jgi:hypothetical protein